MGLLQDASDVSSPLLTGLSTGVVLVIDCDATVFVGAAVRTDAAGVAFNALADDISTSNVLGIVQQKISSTKCVVRLSGATPAIFAGLDPTKIYFLSDTVAGEVTTTVPSGSGHVIYEIGQPLSATKFVVDKGRRVVLS